jgi:hypothetical protein
MAGKKKARAKASNISGRGTSGTHKSRIEAVINRALRPKKKKQILPTNFEIGFAARASTSSRKASRVAAEEFVPGITKETKRFTKRVRATSALSKGIDRAIKIKPKKKRSTKKR